MLSHTPPSLFAEVNCGILWSDTATALSEARSRVCSVHSIYVYCGNHTMVHQCFLSIWQNIMAVIIKEKSNKWGSYKNIKKKKKSSDLHLRPSIIPTPPTRCVVVLEMGQTHTCAFTSSAAFSTPPATACVLYAQRAIKSWSSCFHFCFPTARLSRRHCTAIVEWLQAAKAALPWRACLNIK